MLTISAYAKINLALDVLGRRSDGYHEVVMIMQAVTLADTVTLTEQPGILPSPATGLILLAIIPILPIAPQP